MSLTVGNEVNPQKTIPRSSTNLFNEKPLLATYNAHLCYTFWADRDKLHTQ